VPFFFFERLFLLKLIILFIYVCRYQELIKLNESKKKKKKKSNLAILNISLISNVIIGENTSLIVM
jgi:hypothetical protein